MKMVMVEANSAGCRAPPTLCHGGERTRPALTIIHWQNGFLLPLESPEHLQESERLRGHLRDDVSSLPATERYVTSRAFKCHLLLDTEAT